MDVYMKCMSEKNKRKFSETNFEIEKKEVQNTIS